MILRKLATNRMGNISKEYPGEKEKEGKKGRDENGRRKKSKVGEVER